MKHYIYGSGSHGCLYDSCGAAVSLRAAVETLAETFNLGRTRKAKLLKENYLALKPGDGADYCEITECTCTTPWVHTEGDTPDDWPDYEVK